MPSKEDIEQYQQRLYSHRRTLAYLLNQKAQLGGGFTPPGVMSGIDDARAHIQHIKETLRAWGVPVEDHPDDTEIPPLRSARSAIETIELKPVTSTQQPWKWSAILLGLVVISATIGVGYGLIGLSGRSSPTQNAAPTNKSTTAPPTDHSPRALLPSIAVPTSLTAQNQTFFASQALKTIYGSEDVRYDTSAKAYSIYWTPSPEVYRKYFPSSSNGSSLISRVIGEFPYTISGKDHIMLVTATDMEGNSYCHICSEVIDIGVFFRKERAWELGQFSEAVTRVGSGAQAPTPEFIRFGPDKYGLHFYDTFLAQGFFTGISVIIGEINNKYDVILKELIAQDNAGTCGSASQECWGYTSTIGFDKGPNPLYYNLFIRSSGTKWDSTSRTIVAIDSLRTFIFGPDGYVESKSQ